MIRTQKWVFDGQTRPYEIWNLKTNLVSFVRGKKRTRREREGRAKKRRREEEEEEKMEEPRSRQQGMETHLDYGF